MGTTMRIANLVQLFALEVILAVVILLVLGCGAEATPTPVTIATPAPTSILTPTLTPSPEPAAGPTPTLTPTPSPAPQIMSAVASETFGTDYIFHVTCTVRNRGGSGEVTVTAEFRAGGFWKKERNIFMAAGQTEAVRISFPEASFIRDGLSSGNYNCGAIHR